MHEILTIKHKKATNIKRCYCIFIREKSLVLTGSSLQMVNIRMTKKLKKVVVIETSEKQLHVKMVMHNLDRVIKKAKPNMDKIKDVDEFLDDINNINL